MSKQFEEIVLYEIRENRKEIKDMRKDMSEMDKHIFSNKIKLSLFIGAVSLCFSIGWAILFEKIKHFI